MRLSIEPSVWALPFALLLTTACDSGASHMQPATQAGSGVQPGSTAGPASPGASGAAPASSGGPPNAMVENGGLAGSGGAGTDGTSAAGAEGAAGSAGDGAGGVADAGIDAGDSLEDDPAQAKPRCLQKASQVVLLGDSYINWVSHTFPTDLAKEAGQTFRNYAVGGTSMGSGGIGLIPPQLDQASTQDPDITTVIMTGGGNDVLVPDVVKFPQGADCKNRMDSPSIPDCQTIVATALTAADQMLDDAVALGVTHVIYFFYPHVPDGTLVGGLYPNAILDYSLPRVKDFCDSTHARTGGKLTCHFVDLIPVFAGHADWFAPTDIHPNLQGSAAMAKAIWSTMKDNCIAQPASSGCCAP